MSSLTSPLMPLPATTLEASRAYVAAGISILPIKANGTKRPAFELLPVISEDVEGYPKRGWAPFTQSLPSDHYLERWYGGWGSSCGIAAICGRVSGNLEAIDIDLPELVDPWLDLVRQRDDGLLEKLVLVQTPRPGLHCYYRCPTIERNRKLAQRVVPTDDASDFELVGLIETRGESGYALVPPSPAICHPTRRPYLYPTQRTLLDVQVISPAERSLLFEVSQSFDTPVRRQRQAERQRGVTTPHRPLDRNKPGDDYCARVSWDDLLEGYGWSLWEETPDGEQYWTRPGKGQGVSASVGYGGSDLLYVWTSSVAELEPDTAYSKFSFITHMKYDGDFSRAATALKAQGYGRGTINYRNRSRGRRSSSVVLPPHRRP